MYHKVQFGIVYCNMETNTDFTHDNSHNYNTYMGKNNFSDSLRKLRTWKSVSQKDLGKAMGVTDTTISAWENPKLDRIPPKSMVDLLVEFFEKEIKETSIDLYMDAGYFSSEQEDKVERRLATIEKQLSILVEAYRVDKDV